MLQIELPKTRRFDEATEEFVSYEAVTLKLEHSLISIQKWESKWHKSYLSGKDITREEQLDYIRCMSLDQNISQEMLLRLTANDFKRIAAYIQDPMTATTFSNRDRKGRQQTITAEIIYYWMTEFGIPFTCAKWHLNQLLTLIQVCSIKNAPSKKGKKNKASLSDAYRNLNNARRSKMGTMG